MKTMKRWFESKYLVQWRLLAFLLLLLTAGATAMAGGARWEKEKTTKDGISVASRETPGTTVREVRANLTIAAPPHIVLDAASDPATFAETTKKYVVANRFYHLDNPVTWYNYQVVDYPFVDKRDYCLRFDRTEDADKGLYRLKWRVTNKYAPPPKPNVVRVTRVKGQIDITPLPQGVQSVLQYTVLLDPGGNIPTWVVNMATRRSLPDILRQIRDASLARYKKSK